VPSYSQTSDFLERRHRRSEKRGRPFTQTAAPKATGGVNAGGRITKKASPRYFCDKIAAVPSFDHAAIIDDAAAGGTSPYSKSVIATPGVPRYLRAVGWGNFSAQPAPLLNHQAV
jgi:hypothetical protein